MLNEGIEMKNEKEKLSEKEEIIEFDHLAPVDEVDDPVTLKLIKQALDNKKVRNIALTGSYGGGKSSLLRTFEKENKKDYKYLHISLADFSLEKQEVVKGYKLKELLQKIEKSILQQILYRVGGEELPNSRFKRIRVPNKKNMSFVVLFILLYFLSFVIIFKEEYLKGNFGDLLLESSWIYLWGWTVFTIYSGIILNKLFQRISKVDITKINFKSMEVEMCEIKNDSILNKHLDEILYFFEIQKFNVVIIEDLDRLPNIEIFTKLREINTLINEYEKIEKKITFIYAVKDEIFKDAKERTKFFEMIIPIIPVINSSNSEEKLAEKLVDFNTSKIFIEDISLFIDDMRLLTNISNEFKLYEKQLPMIKDINKLLAMVVYKNLYPNDFAELHLNEGIVYEIINSKKELIKLRLTKIDEEIDKFKDQIKDIENNTKELDEKIEMELIDSRKELRRLYIGAFIELLPQRTQLLKLNNRNIELKDLALESNFDLLRSSTNLQYYNDGWYSSNIRFQEIEEKINSELTYNERVERIELKEKQTEIIKNKNEKINKLKLEVESLGAEKTELNDKKIGMLLKEDRIDFFKKYQDEKLIMFLVREGYIDENYHDYMSYFYVGSLTTNDKEFLSGLKAGIALEFGYSLSNLDNIVPKLRNGDYKEKGILNYDLLSYLGVHFEKSKQRYRKMISLISDGGKNSIKFIEGYLGKFPEDKLFIRELCKKWINIWIYIEKESEFSDDKTKMYLQNILNFADLEDIIEINKENFLKEAMEKWNQFLYLNFEEGKLKLIIKELDIKFKVLDIPEGKQELLDYIYKKNHYVITPKNIKFIIGRMDKNTDIEKLNGSNYSTIKSSGCNGILDYVNENLGYYIENVFLALDKNHNESEEAILELINNEEISLDMRKKIIGKQDVKIVTLEGVTKNLWAELLKKDKLIASWDNIILNYKEDEEVSDITAEFINRKDNFEELSGEVLIDNSMDDKEREKLAIELLKSSKINSETLKKIVRSYSWNYSTFYVEGVEENRVKELISLGMLSLSQKNIDNLKENFIDVHLKLIKQYKKEYLSAPNEIILNIDDLIEILEFKEFDLREKVNLINELDEEIYDHEEAEKLLLSIYNLLFARGKDIIKGDIIDRLIKEKIMPLNQVNMEKIDIYEKNKRIDLIRQNSEEYFLTPNKIKLKVAELEVILESDEFTVTQKIGLANSFKKEIFIQDTDENLIKIICKILYEEEVEEELNKELIDRLVASKEIIDIDHKKAIYYSQKEFLEEEAKLSLFIKLFEFFSSDEITEVLRGLSGDYVALTQRGPNPLIEKRELNKVLCKKLKESNYISSYNDNDDRIRVYTFKK